MNMPLTFPKKLLYLLGAILVLNIVQAYFTELIFDEAYYWYYAQNVSFGYFDHPPMVAWFIALGSLIFEGNLGVRMVSCLLSVGTLLVLWKTIDHPKKNEYVVHFVVLAFSMTLLNAYGFLTLPDTPLLFFCALFLLTYKYFVEKPSALLALALGLVMAALMYSKYHAVLIIVFVLLSNLKLLTNKFAWLAVIVALLAYTPHFLWLFEHEFVSIKYHLFERRNDAYNFKKYSFGFLVNLVALFGFTFPWIYRSLFRSKGSDTFTKALLYLTYGVLLFFFISSFNRRIQTQWIIVISIPLVILVFNDIIANETSRKWIYRMGLINIAILLFLRLGLVFEPLFPIHYESHGNKKWVQQLKDKVGDTPVIFENSYRLASMYTYYSGNPSFSLNNIYYRQNQYSLDNSERSMQGKKVYYISPFLHAEFAFTNAVGDPYYGKYINDFESFRKLRCDIDANVIGMDTEKEQHLKVFNPYDKDIDLKKLQFAIGYLNDYKRLQDIIPILVKPKNQNILVLKSNDTTEFTFTLPPPKLDMPAYFRVSISENDLYFGLNGKPIKLD